MEETNKTNKPTHKTVSVKGMYEDWFLDYASYVILERAVPHVNDGLKPVQRRILHSLKELDDGRYNKVANVVGNTMKYHPHGDASIGDALVQLGQKELLIDCQGNWGNILTGDSAAAPRYIEARLSKFALDVVFNPKTTNWTPSYDGRNQEPETLPIKFPLLLAQGVEGIAVGLACKILPHNFNELIQASISILKGEDFEIHPDFLTGGMIDVERYNDGLRGGRVRVRARIRMEDNRTLVITELPFGVTTTKLIDSIIRANDRNKIKIRKIDDNTAQDVEIIIHLPADTSPDQTIDALYAFTDCEISISPNSTVIDDYKPRFLGVKEILRVNTQNTLDLLRKELEIALEELQERWHWISLERIFIENEIYEKIKPCTTDDSINKTIFEGLKPFVKDLMRKVSLEDVLKLRKIPIDRISKYNADKANDILISVEDDIEQVKSDLDSLIDYAINYFKNILKKYGKGRERKTEIRSFDTIEAQAVAVANEKLYCDYKEGFVGYKFREGEYVVDCSNLDDIIAIKRDGSFVVKRVQEKDFFGKDIIHIDVFRRNDERTVYNLIYHDGATGRAHIKRFFITGVIRDRDYTLTNEAKGTKVLYLSVNPNGEAETVTVNLRSRPKLRITELEVDFADTEIRGRGTKGNILTRNQVRRVVMKGEGVSTLGARKIWFDDSVNRLNVEERGEFLGKFSGTDRILSVYSDGSYRLTGFDLNTHFDDKLILIEKFNPEKYLSVVYLDEDKVNYYAKRFLIEDSDRIIDFLESQEGSKLTYAFLDWYPMIEIQEYDPKKKEKLEPKVINIEELTDLTRYRAKGKRLSRVEIKKIKVLEPLKKESEEEEDIEIAEKKTKEKKEIELNNNQNRNDDDFKQGELF